MFSSREEIKDLADDLWKDNSASNVTRLIIDTAWNYFASLFILAIPVKYFTSGTDKAFFPQLFLYSGILVGIDVIAHIFIMFICRNSFRNPLKRAMQFRWFIFNLSAWGFMVYLILGMIWWNTSLWHIITFGANAFIWSLFESKLNKKIRILKEKDSFIAKKEKERQDAADELEAAGCPEAAQAMRGQYKR